MAVAVSASALVTLVEYKDIFSITGDEENDSIQRLINLASAAIESHCRRLLKARVFTDQLLDGKGRPTLVFPEYPLQSVTSINVDSARTFAAATFLAATDFDIDKASGMLYLRSGSFPSAMRVIKTTFRAGYETTDPEYPVLQGACFEYVRWIKSRYSGFIGKRVETNADGMNIGYEIEMPLNVRLSLEGFVRRIV